MKKKSESDMKFSRWGTVYFGPSENSRGGCTASFLPEWEVELSTFMYRDGEAEKHYAICCTMQLVEG